MAFRIKPCLLAVVLSLAAHVAVAVPVPAAEAGARQVTERKVGAYREVLAAFDEAMRQAPDDAAIAVERCRFIGRYTDDEYGDWVETAPDDFAGSGSLRVIREVLEQDLGLSGADAEKVLGGNARRVLVDGWR